MSEEPLWPVDNSRHNLKWVGMLSNYLQPSCFVLIIRRVYFRLTDIRPVRYNGYLWKQDPPPNSEIGRKYKTNREISHMEFYKPARSFIIICASYTAQCHIHKQLSVSRLGVLIVQMTVRELSHAEVLLIIYIFMCMQDMNVMFYYAVWELLFKWEQTFMHQCNLNFSHCTVVTRIVRKLRKNCKSGTKSAVLVPKWSLHDLKLAYQI